MPAFPAAQIKGVVRSWADRVAEGSNRPHQQDLRRSGRPFESPPKAELAEFLTAFIADDRFAPTSTEHMPFWDANIGGLV